MLLFTGAGTGLEDSSIDLQATPRSVTMFSIEHDSNSPSRDFLPDSAGVRGNTLTTSLKNIRKEAA